MASWDAALSDRMSLNTLSAISIKSGTVSPSLWLLLSMLLLARPMIELRINFQECCRRFEEEDNELPRTRIEPGMMSSLLFWLEEEDGWCCHNLMADALM